MAKKAQRSPQNPQTPEEKAEALRQKAASGTTKPLPTSEGKEKDPEAEKSIEEALARLKAKEEKAAAEAEAKKKALEGKRALLKKLKEELAAEDKAKKEAQKAEKSAKEKAKELALAEREKKAKALEEADAAIAQAEADLKFTEEFQALEKAKKQREAVGPLPKLRKGGTRKSGGGGKKSSNGLTPKMVKILSVMDEGSEYGSRQIADLTEIEKGKPFPLMEELGLIESMVEEGVRGKRFLITKKGVEELAKAQAETEEES